MCIRDRVKDAQPREDNEFKVELVQRALQDVLGRYTGGSR